MTVENPSAIDPRLTSRVKDILLQPKLEWPVIAAEPGTVKGLFVGYAAILAAIGPVCSIIGGLLFGGMFGVLALGPIILTAVMSYVLSLVMVYVLGIIIDALAPNFGSEKNTLQSMKLAVYSMTPVWIAGVLNLVPMLGALAILAALYSIYLIYLGMGPLKATPQDKALGYTAVVILIAIVLNAIVFSVIGAVVASFAIVGMGAAAFALG